MLSIVEGTKQKEQKFEPLLSTDDNIVDPINEESKTNPDNITTGSLLEPSPIQQPARNTKELLIQESTPAKRFKFRRLIDSIMIRICTCCYWDGIKKFRREKPLCSKLILYTTLTFILAVIGGIIFNTCEYSHEHTMIDNKIKLYNTIRSQLPESSYEDLDSLLDLCGVPLVHGKNRWRIQTATFFAFTTASTIGYGYTTPQTFWGRFATFFYGLPAICVFGLAMVQIGSALARTVDKQIKEKHEALAITKTDWYNRFFSWISIELRRTIFVFGLLMLMIAISGGIFKAVQNNWTYTDGLYFMWISISTIGYGDLQPDVIETQLWANAIIWVGLAMTALVIGAAQDYFQKKVKKWRQEDDMHQQANLQMEQKEQERLDDDTATDYRMLNTSESPKDTLELK
eukprot:360897_1